GRVAPQATRPPGPDTSTTREEQRRCAAAQKPARTRARGENTPAARSRNAARIGFWSSARQTSSLSSSASGRDIRTATVPSGRSFETDSGRITAVELFQAPIVQRLRDDSRASFGSKPERRQSPA